MSIADHGFVGEDLVGRILIHAELMHGIRAVNALQEDLGGIDHLPIPDRWSRLLAYTTHMLRA